MSAAFERTGTYDVSVTRKGHRDWTAADVVVTAGVCHVETVTLQAQLVPDP
jgi:hypothetical protein